MRKISDCKWIRSVKCLVIVLAVVLSSQTNCRVLTDPDPEHNGREGPSSRTYSI